MGRLPALKPSTNWLDCSVWEQGLAGRTGLPHPIHPWIGPILCHVARSPAGSWHSIAMHAYFFSLEACLASRPSLFEPVANPGAGRL
jgi:hypothetical protein